jgi:hypothetical protein
MSAYLVEHDMFDRDVIRKDLLRDWVQKAGSFGAWVVEGGGCIETIWRTVDVMRLIRCREKILRGRDECYCAKGRPT